MKISRVLIKNYKSMKDSGDIIIEDNIFALIGQNNAGKSTVLDAIQCVFPDTKKSIEFKDVHKRGDDVLIEVEFSEVTDDYIIEHFLIEKKQKYEEKEQKLILEGKSKDKIKAEHKKYLRKINEEIYSIKQKYEIQDETFILRQIVHTTLSDVKKKQTETRTSGKVISDADLRKIVPSLKVIPAIRNPQNESSAGTNSYLKDLIMMLDDGIETDIEVNNKHINYNELNHILADAISNRCKSLSAKITEKYIDAVGSNDYEIRISSDVNIAKGTSYTTQLVDISTKLASDILNCGTGYQSMLILSILETFLEMDKRKRGYIVIIEEPEVYLHPNLQRKMIQVLLRLSEENQVLFSTHAAITISSLKKNQIRLVVKEHNQSHLEDIDVGNVIKELGIRAEDILMKQGIIMVEGPDDKKIFSELLKKIKPDILSKVTVFCTGNCEKIASFATAEKLLHTVHSIPLLIFRDADCKSVEEQKEILLKQMMNLMNGTSDSISEETIEDCIFIVGKHSLESLFVDSVIINKMIGIPMEQCQYVIKTFNEVYDYVKLNNNKELAKYFQPKYFFENKLDEYGYDNTDLSKKKGLENWENAYNNKWKEYINIVFGDDANERLEVFKNVRKKLNNYTANMMKQRKNYLLEAVEQMDMNILKTNQFSNIIDRLEKFVDAVEK